MTDLVKRHSLKLIGGAGLGATVLSTPALSSLVPRPLTSLDSQTGRAAGRSSADVEISIISTSAIPEQSILLTNTTDEVVKISSFMPGAVVFNDKLVELNSLCNKDALVIEPHHSISSTIEVWQLLAQPVLEYVWAQDAVSALSDETDIVSVGAYVTDQRAIVFPLVEKAAFA